MAIEDLRDGWPCVWCDQRVAKRGTLCMSCWRDHFRRREEDAAQLRLTTDEPAHPWRPWDDVKPKGEYL